MRIHLFRLKRPCPKSVQDIELSITDKEYILQNRIYRPQNVTIPMKEIIKYITKMPFKNKLDKFHTYTKTNPIKFKCSIPTKLETYFKYLEPDTEYYLTNDDFINIIDLVCTINDKANYSDFNVTYDTDMTEVGIMDDEGWTTNWRGTGIRRLVKLIKSVYFDKYEQFLINAISAGKYHLDEFLDIYYNFIGSFDLLPVPYSDVELHKKISKAHQKRVTKSVFDAIKRNGKQNIIDLNNRVIELVRGDPVFKNQIEAGFRPRATKEQRELQPRATNTFLPASALRP